MYQIKLGKKVQKFLIKHRGETIIESFSNALKIIQINPYKNNLDIKSLKGFQNMYRLRIGNYRFIYEIFNNELIINFVDGNSRGGIY